METENVVFTCPRCGCHTLQYKTLVPVYNTVEYLTRKTARKVFPLNKNDQFTYEGVPDVDNEYDYEHETDDGVVCAECGMRWKSLHEVALTGCLQKPCVAIDLEEAKNKPSFNTTKNMEAKHILGVNSDGYLVVLTHLVYNVPSLHSARVAVMKPMTMEDVDDARKHQEPEVCRQYWQEAVAAGDTEQSLEAFSVDLKFNERTHGGKLFAGDDIYMRHETDALFSSLSTDSQNLLLQAMKVGSLEEPDTDAANVADVSGLLPVVAFSCEWTGILEPNWMSEMSVITAGKDVLAIVNRYTESDTMSEEENQKLRDAWLSLRLLQA